MNKRLINNAAQNASSVHNTSKKVAIGGVLITLSFMLSYIEMLLPLPIGIPGVKLGLANLVIVMGFEFGELISIRDLLFIDVGRVILFGLIFGNLSSILFSLVGALVSFVGMYFVYKMNRFTTIGISAVGGIMHNIGQLVVAYYIVKTYYIITYVPVLLWVGLGTGVLLGWIASITLPKLQIFRKYDKKYV